MAHKPSGIFVTPEELKSVRAQQSMTGVWDSQGTPLGDPQRVVSRLIETYGVHKDSGLNAKNGEFWIPIEGPER